MVLRTLQNSEIDLIWQHISRRELITQMYIQNHQHLELVDCFFDVQEVQQSPTPLLHAVAAMTFGSFENK